MIRAPYIPQPGTIPYRIVQHLRALPEGAEVNTAELCDKLNLDISGPLGAYMVSAIKNGVVVGDTRRVEGAARKITFWRLGRDTAPVAAEPEEADEDLSDSRPPVPKSAWSFPPRSVFEIAQAQAEPKGKKTAPVPEAAEQPAPAPKPEKLLDWKPAPPAPAPVDPVGAEEMADAVLASASAPAQAAAPALSTDHARELSAALTTGVEQAPEPSKAGPFACAIWSDGRLQMQRGGAELLTLTVDETRQLMAYLERMAVPA